jgi:hypothetical protein
LFVLFTLKSLLIGAAKVQKLFFAPTFFLKKMKKARPNLILPFSKY